MTKDLGNGIGELGHHDESADEASEERHGSLPEERSGESPPLGEPPPPSDEQPEEDEDV